MKKIILTVAIFFMPALFWQCSGDKGESLSSKLSSQLALMPASDGLAYLNFEKIRNSLLYELILDSLDKVINEYEHFEEFAEASGFDIGKNVKEVLVSINTEDLEHGHSFLAVVSGQFDNEKIMAYIEKEDKHRKLRKEIFAGVNIYRSENEDHPVFALPDGNRMVIGNERLVKNWLEVHQSGTKKSITNKELLAGVKYKNSAWLTVNTAGIVDKIMDEMKQHGNHRIQNLEAVQSIQKVQFSVDIGNTLKMDGEGRFSDAQNARLFHDAAKGALAILKLSLSHSRDAVDVVNKIKIETNNNSIHFDVEMTKEDIHKLIKTGHSSFAILSESLNHL